jgi:crotonobetainyl-CoA:carnitine CoA-transferase CaiB-like acyl-CoA transferase
MVIESKGALSGITVLDLSRMLPGPYASMILADHGARVIAIEDRRFMADDLFIDTVNRNKEHISLNLKHADGQKIFRQLLQGADVVMEGFRPGVVNRLGVDYDSVRRVNPGIIYCAITGYGQTGPLRDRAGHDVNYMAQAGVLDLVGEKDRPPAIPAVQIADIAGGGLNAAIGILLALFAREKTGQGQYIDISMTDGILGLLSLPLYTMQRRGRAPERGDTALSHRYACYNVYETKDGRFISVGAVENRFWEKLCRSLEVPEFGSLQYDEDRREEITVTLRRIFQSKTLGDWEEILTDVDACWAPVRTIEEVLNEPLFREREMVVENEGKGSPQKPLLGIPVKLNLTAGSIRSAPVSFGQNTRDILQELGYEEEDIARLAKDGVI